MFKILDKWTMESFLCSITSWSFIHPLALLASTDRESENFHEVILEA